ncbi:MAG: rhodanese-like domain-containing protein, partial [Chloroflexota bacterium]|nr:rhodanese-like domain-containing protein [Chloroflexota bacterium]
MNYTTLISTAELVPQLDDPDWMIVDCRFVLNEPAVGRQKYLEAHIPGAIYAHLDEDLSGPPLAGQSGRHPLPTVETFAETLSAWGIDANTQVIAYDDASGVYAGRLWWM